MAKKKKGSLARNSPDTATPSLPVEYSIVLPSSARFHIVLTWMITAKWDELESAG